MRALWQFLVLRFVQFRGDFNSIFFSFGFPVILVLGLGFFFSGSGQDRILVHYLANEGVPASAQILENLKASPIIETKELKETRESALALLANNRIAFLLEFDQTNQPFVLHYNTLEPDAAIRHQALVRAMEQGDRAFASLDSRILKAREKPYIFTILPGALGLVLLTIAFIGVGGVLVEERDLGIFKKLKTIDARPFPFLGGLLLSRLLVCVALVFLMMGVTHLAFGVQAYASLPLLLPVSILGTLCFLGIALWLASYSKSQAGYMGLINLVQLPLIVLGGVFFSIDNFPAWLQDITIYSPLTAFTVSFQKIIYENLLVTDVARVGRELMILGGWSVLTLVGGMKAFKW